MAPAPRRWRSGRARRRRSDGVSMLPWCCSRLSFSALAPGLALGLCVMPTIRRAFFPDDPAVLDTHDAVGERNDTRVMGDDQNAATAVARDLGQHRHDGVAVF